MGRGKQNTDSARDAAGVKEASVSLDDMNDYVNSNEDIWYILLTNLVFILSKRMEKGEDATDGLFSDWWYAIGVFANSLILSPWKPSCSGSGALVLDIAREGVDMDYVHRYAEDNGDVLSSLESYFNQRADEPDAKRTIVDVESAISDYPDVVIRCPDIFMAAFMLSFQEMAYQQWLVYHSYHS